MPSLVCHEWDRLSISFDEVTCMRKYAIESKATGHPKMLNREVTSAGLCNLNGPCILLHDGTDCMKPRSRGQTLKLVYEPEIGEEFREPHAWGKMPAPVLQAFGEGMEKGVGQ